MEFTYIYALLDPHTDQVRYVGKSNNPERRFKAHLEDVQSNSYKARWIATLKDNQQKPKLSILEQVEKRHWREAEKRWIYHFRTLGKLTNLTDGGDGMFFVDPEVRRRIITASHTPEANKKRTLAKAWYSHSAETIKKISHKQKGRPLSEDHKMQLRAAWCKRPKTFSKDRNEKISATLRSRYRAGLEPSRSMLGKSHTEQSKQKTRESIQRWWDQRKAIASLMMFFFLLLSCSRRISPSSSSSPIVPLPQKTEKAVVSIPKGSNRYDRFFHEFTLLHFGSLVSPRWTKAVGMAESNLKYNAKSGVGALGLMQFMGPTWASVAPEPYKSLGPLDPESAIWVGCKYLRWNWNRLPVVNSDERKAFVNAAYNSGLGNIFKARAKCQVPCDKDIWSDNVEKSLVTAPQFQAETRGYVIRIRKFEKQLLFAGEFL